LQGGVNRHRVADVERDADATQLVRHILGGGCIEVGHCDLPPVGSESTADGAADASCASGDERDAVNCHVSVSFAGWSGTQSRCRTVTDIVQSQISYNDQYNRGASRFARDGDPDTTCPLPWDSSPIPTTARSVPRS